MPLGVIYFSVIVVLFTLSVSFMVAPLIQSITDFPLLSLGEMKYYIPSWLTPLFLLLGFLIWTVTMHLGRWIGSLHGKYAKMFLVTD